MKNTLGFEFSDNQRKADKLINRIRSNPMYTHTTVSMKSVNKHTFIIFIYLFEGLGPKSQEFFGP